MVCLRLSMDVIGMNMKYGYVFVASQGKNLTRIRFWVELWIEKTLSIFFYIYKLEILVICSSNILKNGWIYGYWLWWMVLDLCDKYGFFMFINLMHLKVVELKVSF